MKVLLDVQNRSNKKPFILPLVASQDGWINEFLKNVFICKEALEILFGIGHEGMRVLVQHTNHNTLPIHELSERFPKVTTKFQENVVPPFAYFFKNQTPQNGRCKTYLILIHMLCSVTNCN